MLNYGLKHNLQEHEIESPFSFRLQANTDAEFLTSSLMVFQVEVTLCVKECKPYVIVDVFGKVSRF